MTAPTLFMGFGALLWVPLSLGMGRRPAFLIVVLMMLLATIGAGYAKNFYQLLTCLCFTGLGEGFFLTSVGNVPSSKSTRTLTSKGSPYGNRHDVHPSAT